MKDLHRLPIVITKHASDRLGERFNLFDEEEINHYIHNSRILKPIGKDGSKGILECNRGDKKIRFVCTIVQMKLVVITVEEG